MTDPTLASAIADEFRSGSGQMKFTSSGPYAGVDLVFRTPGRRGVFVSTDGDFRRPDRDERKGSPRTIFAAEYKAGSTFFYGEITLWKTDRHGTNSHLNSIRLDIQSNRENELLRFRRGEIHFIDKLEPELSDVFRRICPKPW